MRVVDGELGEALSVGRKTRMVPNNEPGATTSPPAHPRELGYTITTGRRGEFAFCRPDGRPITNPSIKSRPGQLVHVHRRHGPHITHQTSATLGYARGVEYSTAVGALLDRSTD